MKTILTVVGIRPDFIRMSAIFKKLDENFHHILIHTGQHYDELLSSVFFEELKARNEKIMKDTYFKGVIYCDPRNDVKEEVFRNY